MDIGQKRVVDQASQNEGVQCEKTADPDDCLVRLGRRCPEHAYSPMPQPVGLGLFRSRARQHAQQPEATRFFTQRCSL